MDNFTITVSELSLEYLPQYLAQELGLFKKEGLEVFSKVPDVWTETIADLRSGQADCIAGNMWTPLLYHNRVENFRGFAKASSRCPMVLLSRKPIKEFAWRDMEGKIVLVTGANDCGPRMYLYGCAKEGGADVSRIKFVYNFYEGMLAECFTYGWGDFVLLSSVVAYDLVKAGKGYVAVDLTTTGGSVPWNIYYVSEAYLSEEKNVSTVVRFTRALQNATDWLHSHNDNDCKKVLEKLWPDRCINEQLELLNKYRENGVWNKTVRIDEKEFNRWVGFIADNHLIDGLISYNELIDSRPYEQAMKQA